MVRVCWLAQLALTRFTAELAPLIEKAKVVPWAHHAIGSVIGHPTQVSHATQGQTCQQYSAPTAGTGRN